MENPPNLVFTAASVSDDHIQCHMNNESSDETTACELTLVVLAQDNSELSVTTTNTADEF